MTRNARIKINPYHKIDIYDMIVIDSLRKICGKLYVYIDDRDEVYDPNKVEEVLETIKKFNITIDCIIKYSEYYFIAWIYIHKLVKTKNVIIESNYVADDKLDVLSKNQDIKIYIKSDKLPKAESLIYSGGWFRELFLISIMDDSEMINYIPDNNINSSKYSAINTISTNDILVEIIKHILSLEIPTPVLSNLVSLCNNERVRESANVLLNDLTFQDIIDVGINLVDLRHIIEKECGVDNNSDGKIINLVSEEFEDCFDKIYALRNPVTVNLDDNKTAIINDNNILLSDTLFIENSSITDTHKTRLKYAGALKITKRGDTIKGSWIKYDKKKLKNTIKWLPCNESTIKLNCGKDIYVIYCNPILDIKHKIIKIGSVYHIIKNNDLVILG